MPLIGTEQSLRQLFMTADEVRLLSQDEIDLLANAPIREAILQVNFNSMGIIPLEDLARIKELLPSHFGELGTIITSEFNFQIAADSASPATNAVTKHTGYRIKSEQDRVTLSFQQDAFNISLAAPYSDWRSFKALALTYWRIFKGLLPPLEYTRAALRYVNELSIELDENGQLDFDDYLEFAPQIPKDFGNLVETFFCRVVIPYQEQNVKIVLIQSFKDIVDGRAKILLDLEVGRDRIQHFTEAELWNFFDTLRLVKDTAFFKSITSKAKDKFK